MAECALTVSLHSDSHALVEAAELAGVARVLVDHAVLALLAGVREALLHGALEEALASLTAEHAVVVAGALVAAHQTRHALAGHVRRRAGAAVVRRRRRDRHRLAFRDHVADHVGTDRLHQGGLLVEQHRHVVARLHLDVFRLNDERHLDELALVHVVAARGRHHAGRRDLQGRRHLHCARRFYCSAGNHIGILQFIGFLFFSCHLK